MSTSTSSSITTTTVNGTSRITGLSSGIDVDSIVDQLMTAEKAKKLNKLEQQEQLSEWKQDAYRDIISDIETFSDTYFSTTSSSSLIKQSNYLQYKATSSSSAVSVSYTSSASAGNHTIEVDQLATQATLSSSSSISKDVQGDSKPTYSSLSGKSFVITLDGTKRTVSLDNVTDIDSLQAAIDDAVGDGKLTVSADSSTGYLSITAAANGGTQEIAISDPSSGTSGLSALGFGDNATLSNRLDTSDTLATIANQLNTSTALTFNSDGQIDLTINGTTKSFDKTATLADMIEEINNADLGVTMEYDELSGKLVMTADDTGAGSTLVVTEGSGSNFLSTCMNEATEGLDAKVTIDGTTLTRSSNTITLDGVVYTLNQTTSDYSTLATADKTTAATAATDLSNLVTAMAASTGSTSSSADQAAATAYTTAISGGDATAIADAKEALLTQAASSDDTTVSGSGTGSLSAYNTAATAAATAAAALSAFSSSDDDEATVSLTLDTDAIYDLISNFADAYNTLISTINDELDESYDSDYLPLTDDQKDSMTDEEITKWEAKAKTGILEDDSLLKGFLSAMRESLIDSVSGSTATLTSIGITTGTYDENGKLEIDEDTLKSAISSDATAVMKLFSQTSTTYSSNSSLSTLTSSQLSVRYKQEGIAYRFYDTLYKYVSTNYSSKGSLLKKAGMDGDTSDTNNTLTTLIDKYAKEISEEEDRLDDYEDRLYDKYTTLETYISKMNSQLSALSSMSSS